MRFKNKKALVTGSSGGIGKAIALQLGKEGASVIVHYHENKLEAVKVQSEIIASGGKAEILQADLSDFQQAAQLGEKAWKVFSGIDYLINNAGVSYKKQFLETSSEDIDHFTNINFKATLVLTQHVAKKMIAGNVLGSIYTVTSINGLYPGVGLSVYGATKGALETLMKGVALELSPHRIHVNTLAVGAIETDMNKNISKDPDKLKLVSDHIPMGRMGQPEEVASVLCALLETGTYMTGVTITIDGGWILNRGYVKPTPYTGDQLG